MITEKDAKQIREALEKAFELCSNPEQRQGVMRVRDAFVGQWADGVLSDKSTSVIEKDFNK